MLTCDGNSGVSFAHAGGKYHHMEERLRNRKFNVRVHNELDCYVVMDIAKEMGCPIDYPRNLAKSVTVE